MSIEIPFESLNEKLGKKLCHDLTITPTDENAFFNKFKSFGNTKDKSVSMFLPDTERNVVKIPYLYGLKLGYSNPKNKYKKLKKNDFNIDLRDYQIKIVESALKDLKKHKTTTLGVPPGDGKTIMGTFIAWVKGFYFIVFMDREVIAYSWIETMRLCLPNIDFWFVNKKPPPTKPPQIIICMVTRFKSIPENFIKYYGTVIFDEAHRLCTESRVECLLYTRPKYVILETATLFRDDDMHKMVQLMAGEHGIFKNPDRPYNFYLLNTNIQVAETKNSAGKLNATKMYSDLSKNKRRNEMVIRIILDNPHRKFIILSLHKTHIEELCKMADEEGIEYSTLYGKNNDYQDSKVLFGTMSKIGYGFDETRACKNFKGEKSNTLILLHTTKKYQSYQQMAGRVMRELKKTCAVIWFQDCNSMFKRHFIKIRPWIKKTGGKIIEVEWDYKCIELPDKPKKKLKILN